MGTKTPIAAEDIQVGDLVRSERGEIANEWRVGKHWSAKDYAFEDTSYFLLDRPKKVKWSRGTTLWLNRDFAGQSAGFEAIVMSDHHEDDYSVNVSWPGGAQCIFAHRFTDIKPDPHPVGAIRWVTEDTESPYGKEWKRGERVEVTSFKQQGGRILEVYPTDARHLGCFGIDPKYLSATQVEPWPSLVAVPLPAIKKLRDGQERAFDARKAEEKNDIRRDSIASFLGTRSVQMALENAE